MAPCSETSSKRVTTNIRKATATALVNAVLVTRFQNRLAITGNTMAPQSAPTKISMERMSSFMLAKITPISVAVIIVRRPTQSMVVGFGRPRARFLP